MNELISQHARTVLIPDRQCTATNRDGQRCKRASALGALVCNLHGGATPLSIKAARERLLAMVEPALDALLRALQTGPPCEHCGRSDSDRDPVVVRAAQLVLDRTGFNPTLTVEQAAAPPNKYESLSDDELVEHLERLLETARGVRDAKLARALPEAVEDGCILDEKDL